MSSRATPYWDGNARADFGDASQLVSPYDRPPVPARIAAASVPANASDNRKRVTFAPWCGWVYVLDAGGADLVIVPSLGGGIVQPAATGDVVWIGNGSCEVAYLLTAPSSEVRLIGCTSIDALLYSAQGRAGAGAGGSVSPIVTTSARIISKNYDGLAYDPAPVPGTGPRVVQIGADTTMPPGVNDPAAVFCLASTAALSKIEGAGFTMAPGGTQLWPGGPAWICEVFNTGAAGPAVSTVVYTS